MSDEERRAFENLLVLCPTCHARVDETEPKRYTVERLEEMKARHEGAPCPPTKVFLDIDDRIVELVLVAYRAEHGIISPAAGLHAADPRDYDRTLDARENTAPRQDLTEPAGAQSTSYPNLSTRQQRAEVRSVSGTDALDGARWLRTELSRVAVLEGVEFRAAVEDASFVHEVSDVLVSLEPSISAHVSAADSAALAVDNLGSILDEAAGVRRLLQSLNGLIDALERERSGSLTP